MSIVTLSSVLSSLESGTRPKGGVSGEGDGIPSIGGEHLDANGGFRFENIKLIPEVFFNGMAKGRIAVDDILVVKDGATTGKTSFVGPDFPYPVAAVNEHVFVVRVDSRKAWPKYAFHYLHSAVGQADIRKDFRGATVGGISRGFVDVVQFPLPTLPEQKRIAAILDASDALRAKRRESIEQLDSLIQSTFLEIFGDPVTNPKGWAPAALQTLATRITKGASPKWQGFDYVDDGVLFVTSENVRDGYLSIQPPKFVPQAFHTKLRGSQLAIGDLLINLVGASIGRSALFQGYAGPANVNQAVGVVSLKNPTLARYILGALQTTAGKTLLTGNIVEAARANISLRNLRELQIPLPPPAIQNRFASIVESIEQQKARLKAHLAELDTLFASLQSRAFNGELVA
jgi:type I restriction enzyme S subunit